MITRRFPRMVALVPGVGGGSAAVIAGYVRLQHAIRKNELVIGRIVGNWLWLLGLQLIVILLEHDGVVDIGRFLALALGLGFFEEFEGALEQAGDALFVEGEVGERLDVHFKRTSGGAGGDSAIVRGLDVVVFALDGVEGEQALFVGGDAV